MSSFKRKFIQDRIGLLMVVFFIIGCAAVFRLFQLQIIRGSYFRMAASGQHKLDKEILQSRGEIFIYGGDNQNLSPLAINRKLTLVYAVPSEIHDPTGTARILAEILEPNEELRQALEDEIFDKIKKENDPYEPIWHRASDKDVEKIKSYKVEGIYFDPEWERYYPIKEAAAHVSGFLGYSTYKREGQYGVEGYFNDELTGEKGKMLGAKDVGGRIIPTSGQKVKDARDGVDIILTLDKIVQTQAYKIISQAVEDYGAENGTIIVIDPKSGKIKAMANFPSFDPNNYGETENIEAFRNLAVSQTYEPGSIFKIITMGIGLDSGAVKVDDTYVDEGFVKFGKETIHNADNATFGEMNMTEVLENSINTGAVYVALNSGKNNYLKYIKKFGFGDIFGQQFFGEAGGDISSLEKKGEIYLATASYGQGITVTPLQIAVAMATVVNDGKFVYPILVDYIKDCDGNVEYIENKKSGQQIIDVKTSILLKAMLISVVKNGHGGQAGVPGYYIGGKTGTAEIASSGISGYSNKNNHSFIGFGPLEDTRFVIMVKLTEPKFGRFSAITAAPTFAKMASFLLQYYQVPPEYN
ncbi:MAG: penicillin-binding protein 2 [Candidatus Kuenenbacteria bacterium]